MYALKYNNPFQQPATINNTQYPTLLVSNQHSQTKQKTQLFKIEIRNNQLHNIKKRCRQQLLISQQIDSLLNTLPVNWNDSLEWSSDFIRLYNEVKTINLDSHQMMAIFFLAQKFPNRLTLQLLEIIVLRVPGEYLEILFQYDVMRLLHSAIVYQDAKRNGTYLNRSASSQQSETIIRQAVVDRVSTAIARIDLRSDQTSECDIFQMVRCSLSIIGELCLKSAPARNFAVINHKTYVYCLKAYKKYNEAIRKQFFRFLKSVTEIKFARYQDQFERIKGKILGLVFKQNWKIEYIDSSAACREMLYCMKMLVLAARNLFAMENKQTLQKIHETQNKYNYTLYEIARNLIIDISNLLVQMKQVPQQACGLLSASIDLVMHYEDHLQYIKTVTANPRYFLLKSEMAIIYNHLIYILYCSIAMGSLVGVRRSIYFALHNHLVDQQISEQNRYALLQIGHKVCHIKLLHLLNELLAVQFYPPAFYQLSYMIYSMFYSLPLSLLAAYIFDSQLVPGLCGRILESFSSEEKQFAAKLMLVRSLLVLLQRIKREGNRSLSSLKSIIKHQYSNKLNVYLSKQTIMQSKLYEEIEQLLNYLQGEEYVLN